MTAGSHRPAHRPAPPEPGAADPVEPGSPIWECGECYARMPQARQRDHMHWHDALRTRIRQLESVSRALEAKLRRG